MKMKERVYQYFHVSVGCLREEAPSLPRDSDVVLTARSFPCHPHHVRQQVLVAEETTRVLESALSGSTVGEAAIGWFSASIASTAAVAVLSRARHIYS
jgi:hypothetical protein